MLILYTYNQLYIYVCVYIIIYIYVHICIHMLYVDIQQHSWGILKHVLTRYRFSAL